MQKFLILTDYRNQFWLKTNYKEESVDTNLLSEVIARKGYDVCVKSFADICFRTSNYQNWLVFYQSSEDPDLLYKSYIEDVLLGLKLQGAILIPDYQYLRAHHNKVFMEILREIKGNDTMKALRSWYFGTYEDYCKTHEIDKNEKHVFKLSTGAQSRKVLLLDNKRKHISIPEKQSRSFNWHYWAVDQIKPFWKSRYPGYRKKSHHRRKFVIQEFIDGLTCDYKVIVFSSNKIYILTRGTRPNDFRASGSGIFKYERDIPKKLLDFSLEVFNSFSVPFVSMDIAIEDEKPYLIEFQFTSFGTYTVEKSPFYFQKSAEGWNLVEGKSIIEFEYAEAIHDFIEKGKDKLS